MTLEKVLLTGGAGYIGSVLTGRLLERGYHVTVLDNLTHHQPSLLQYAANKNFEFVQGDVRDESIIAALLKDRGIVIPLAAVVGAPACHRNPELAEEVNFGSIAMLNRLRGEEHRIVSPCTNSGYGAQTGDYYCTEETPLEPISLYGTTKVRAEAELLSRPNTISLRLATVFGPSPRMRLDLLVNDFVYRAATDRFLVIYESDFTRNYIHIQDVASAFLHCIDNFDAMKGEPYNAGLDSANVSKRVLAEKIKEQVPELYLHFAEIGTDPDKRNYVVSNEKLASKGFAADTSLEEGIRQLLSVARMLPHTPYGN